MVSGSFLLIGQELYLFLRDGRTLTKGLNLDDM